MNAISVATSECVLGGRLVDGGATFAVWAPHADRVGVSGSFGGGEEREIELTAVGDGKWEGFVEQAAAGDEYDYIIYNGAERLTRNDPYARRVTQSNGRSVLHDTDFEWNFDHFRMDNWNELLIYELHIGTFHRPDKQRVGTFDDAAEKLDYLAWLGVNAIEIMPTAEFAGDFSWGYNPAHPFAVETAYGGPDALKRFVDQAHERGIAVIMDVVYNHFGPSDLDLWQFDGWSENGKGGIYFYNDHRSATPWGDTRPDYGRGEVRQYLHDNAMMWIDEYRMDGLRYDMTLYMRSVDGNDSTSIPEGWSLVQWINREVHARYPGKITIAEDLRNNDGLTKPGSWGGANFSSQWDAEFVHPIRAALIAPNDADRSMSAVRNAILHRYNHDAFERVIYTESHDEVANGKARVPSEIDPENPDSWHARKRSTLGAALVLTSPGVPMLFQGQEFLRRGWFDDARAIDWGRPEERAGTLRLYRDLIALRRNLHGVTAGLCGQRVEIVHENDVDKVMAFLRWRDGGPGDHTLVVANFGNRTHEDYRVGVPAEGVWKVRVNTDSAQYDEAEPGGFPPTEVQDALADAGAFNNQRHSIEITLPAYSAVVLSQDAKA